MAPKTELTALAQEIMEMDSETFEVSDYLDSADAELGLTVYTSSTSSTSSCSSTA